MELKNVSLFEGHQKTATGAEPGERPTAEREIIWVDTAEKLRHMLDRLMQEPRVAVDTESDNMFAYRESVALLQFSTPKQDFLVDPKSDIPIDELGPFFADPDVEKIFHAAEYDLIGLWRDYRFKVNHIFDTMQASRILGKERVGLAALLQEYFGVTLDKRWQRADWSKRPLPPEQLAYAVHDTRYLIPLRDILHRELVEQGLWELAQEDFLRLSQPKEVDHAFDPEAFWHLPGADELTPEQLRLLRALYVWREEEARRRNVPPFKVMHNRELVALARRFPHSVADIKAFLGSRRARQRRLVSSLWRAVREAAQADIPSRPRRGRRPSQEYIQRLEKLRAWRRDRARALGVESDIVLPREAMERLAREAPQSLEELRALDVLGPVRIRTYGEEILRLLRQ